MASNTNQRGSHLTFYSLGIVTSDKARNSDKIKVYPVEDLPMIDGKVTDFLKKYDVNMPDAKGVVKSSKAEGTAVIEASWISLGVSNRMSSPDVIKNETVLLLKYSDAEEFYWITIFREPKIRRLETVLYAFGNLVASLVPWDKLTSYWFEVSTHDKHIKLHTSKSNGEPFEYDVTIDTRNGYIEIKDDIGNVIKLDSKENTIDMTANKEINLVAPTVNISGSAGINMSSSTSINQKAPDLNVTANTNMTGNIGVAGDVSMGGSGAGINISGGNVDINAASAINNNAPVVNNSGDEVTAGTSTANPHMHYAP